jgi:RHS repeat-associated protein
MELASNAFSTGALVSAAIPQLAGNSRQGFGPVDGTMRWASSWVISSNTLGIKGSLYDGDAGSRSPGKERDSESGNDYFGARYFGSSMGRFLSPDPSQLYFANPADPQSLNLYSYGRNNPLINIDPTGLDCVYDDGGGNFHTGTGDCDNSTEALANAGHYIDCDGCTTNSASGTLDPTTGTMYLNDANGNAIAGTNISDWAAPQGVSTDIVINGNNQIVGGGGYGAAGFLNYDPYANLNLPPAEISDPNAPRALPKLKGKDKWLCLWGGMTNEMLGGEGGPEDSDAAAPGRKGAAPVPFNYVENKGRNRGKAATKNLGTDTIEEGDAKGEGAVTLLDWAANALACTLN